MPMSSGVQECRSSTFSWFYEKKIVQNTSFKLRHPKYTIVAVLDLGRFGFILISQERQTGISLIHVIHNLVMHTQEKDNREKIVFL